MKILCSQCRKFFISKESLTNITIACEICKTCVRKIRNDKKIQKMSLSERAEMALKEAVRGVIEDHARLGLPLVVWRNGKGARVSARRILREKKVARLKKHKISF